MIEHKDIRKTQAFDDYELNPAQYESAKFFADIWLTLPAAIIAIIFAPFTEQFLDWLVGLTGISTLIAARTLWAISPLDFAIMIFGGSLIVFRTVLRRRFFVMISKITDNRRTQSFVGNIVYFFFLLIYLFSAYCSFNKYDLPINLTYTISFIFISLVALVGLTWLIYLLKERIRDSLLHHPLRQIFILSPLAIIIMILLTAPAFIGIGLNIMVDPSGRITDDDYIVLLTAIEVPDNYQGELDKTLPETIKKRVIHLNKTSEGPRLRLKFTSENAFDCTDDEMDSLTRKNGAHLTVSARVSDDGDSVSYRMKMLKPHRYPVHKECNIAGATTYIVDPGTIEYAETSPDNPTRVINIIHGLAGYYDLRFDLALRELEKPESKDKSIYVLLANSAYINGKGSPYSIEDTRRYLGSALRLDPDDTIIRNNLAAVLLEIGQYGEAAETLALISNAEFDKSPWLYNNLAIAKYRSGDEEGALESLDFAANNSENTIESLTIRSNMAMIHFEQNRRKTAEELYQKILAVDDGFIPARYGLARCMIYRGETGVGKVELRRALEQSPRLENEYRARIDAMSLADVAFDSPKKPYELSIDEVIGLSSIIIAEESGIDLVTLVETIPGTDAEFETRDSSEFELPEVGHGNIHISIAEVKGGTRSEDEAYLVVRSVLPELIQQYQQELESSAKIERKTMGTVSVVLSVAPSGKVSVVDVDNAESISSDTILVDMYLLLEQTRLKQSDGVESSLVYINFLFYPQSNIG